MNHHEREFFIYKIRSGKAYLPKGLVVHPFTIELNIESCIIYNNAYEQAFDDEIMTEKETESWMMDHGLWSEEKEERVNGLKKDIEKLKVEIYKSRHNSELVERIRKYIRAGEKQLNEELQIKNSYNQNTCEGIAYTEKLEYLIENSTYKNNELYDFEDIGINEALFYWHKSLITEQQCRELARTEPWKSLWNIYEKSGAKLFFNKDDEDITYNQTTLTMWSQMYDNIQESMDCPTKEVIEDDDMLDGWFIVQAEKREQEKAENEFDNNTNEKVKNSDEVFVMAKNENDINRVENMNSLDSKVVKKQRAAVMKKKGSAQQQDFKDEIMKQKTKQMEAFKGKFGGK
jgi:hypothetical protein